MSAKSSQKIMPELKTEKLNKKDFELNKCFCRPKKRFKERERFPKAGVQILENLVEPEVLLKR